jgi:FKBP-type peptidyl-prolyl cis-trans isomerase 2
VFKIKKGDIVRLEYSAWVADSGELFDTSVADVAKEGGLFNENVSYVPVPILVGSGRVFEGLDEAVMGSQVGEEREIVLPPEKAAGARDPKLIEQIPLREFLKQDIEPNVGMEVNIRNRIGTIMSVTPRTVRVDFNRKFAGKALKYKFKITCKLVEPTEKVLALLEMDYGTSDGFKPTVEGEDYTVIIPDVCKYDQKWLIAKYKVVADLREAFNAKTVRFVEEYARKEEEKKAEVPAEAAKTEESVPEVLPKE